MVTQREVSAYALSSLVSSPVISGLSTLVREEF